MKIFTNADYTSEQLSIISKENMSTYLGLFKSIVVAQTLFPIALALVFWSLIESTYLWSWLTIQWLITFSRAYLTFVWYQPNSSPQHDRQFERLSLLLCFFAGLSWGATVLVMDFVAYPEASVFLNIVIFGLVAGTTGNGSYWFGQFLTLNYTMISCYILAYFFGIPEQNIVLAISLVIFLFFITQIVLVFHRSNAENIYLRMRNEKLAANLAKQKLQAEELAESRSRFLAAASHDLRQPLQALNFFLAALKNDIKNNNNQLLFSQLEKSADNMNQLLNSILDISKLDANTLQLDIKSFNLGKLLLSLQQQYQNQADKKSLALIVDIDDNFILCDEVLCSRVISNLLVNALLYTESGSVTIKQTVLASTIQLDIIDTGIGMSDEQQSKVFEEFYQVGNSERDRQKGLGLGLSIVKRLCELLNIYLSLQSEAGKGTHFTLEFPKTEKISETEPSNKSHYIGDLTDKIIVVIDDEESIRLALETLLTQWGAQVMVADSAVSAMAIIEQEQRVPHMIISDYRLRNNENGVAAINFIREALDSKIACLIMSGDTQPERLKEVAKSGFSLLHKPVKPAQLRMAIQKLLSQNK